MTKHIFSISLLLLMIRSSAKDYAAATFGIHSDGIVLNTRSIQFAIDYINRNGGGRLVFDVGRYLTGTIYLKSSVTLQLEEGAVLLGSLNPFDYEKPSWTALVFAIEQHDIAITGKGIIDGQGKLVARAYVDAIAKGFIKDPLRYGRAEADVRPMNIYMRGCRNITVKDITLRNSASWNQTYDQCKNVSIDHITVDNKAYWNEDGVDIVDCDSVSVTNSYIDAADDGICLKSHDPKFYCDHVLIQNNTIRSSANGIKFGTASLGGFKNVRILNNKVFDTYRSAVALETVDGGFVENITIDSLQVYHTGHLIFLRVGERRGEPTSRMSGITISHVRAEIAATKPDAGYEYEGPEEDMPRNISPAIIIAGLASKRITGVRFDHIIISHPGGGNPYFARVSLEALDSVPEIPAQYPDFSMFKELPAWAVYIRHAANLQFSNMQLICDKKDYRIPIVADDVQSAQFSTIQTKQPGGGKTLYQYKSSGIVVK